MRFSRPARALVWLLCVVLPLFPASAEEEPLLWFTASSLEAAVGARIDLTEYLAGELALSDDILFSCGSDCLRVGEDGVAEVLSAGTAEITAVSGGASAVLTVRAVRTDISRYALILCEQRYWDGRVRTGAVNTAQGMSDMLNALRYRSGSPFATTVRIDSTEAELAAAVAEAFGEAEEGDVSLFYISCHGELRDGEPMLILHDGSRLGVAQLERLLRGVRGRVVVLIDCCSSGAFIGRAASRLYAESAAQCFADSPLTSGKYLVMTSCGSDEDSYRISDTGEATESAMSTVFARALCEGLGWDLNLDRSVSLRADADRNGVVTFTELWVYTRRRVLYHLAGTGAEQNVMAWPELDELALFARQAS